MRSFGWVEGRTVHIEHRFAAADAGRYQPLAKELVALQPEVILAVSTPVTAALQRETNVIPIVFLGVSDPIGSGFAANLARPGSNLTGIMLYEHRHCRQVAGDAQGDRTPPYARRSGRQSPNDCLRLFRAECRRLLQRHSRSSSYRRPLITHPGSNARLKRSRAFRTAAFSWCPMARPLFIAIS